MVIAHFDNELGAKRLPFAGALGAPAARTARSAAGEAGWRDELLQAARQRRLFLGRQRCREAGVVEEALLVIEAEQQRADERAVRVVAKATDDAIGGAGQLVFLHAVAAAVEVGQVGTLGDKAIDVAAEPVEPSKGDFAIG